MEQKEQPHKARGAVGSSLDDGLWPWHPNEPRHNAPTFKLVVCPFAEPSFGHSRAQDRERSFNIYTA